MNDLWERAVELWYRFTPRPSIPVDDVIAILQSVNQIAARRIGELETRSNALEQHVRLLTAVIREREDRTNTHQ